MWSAAFYRELDIVKYNLAKKKERLKNANDDMWIKMGFRQLPPAVRRGPRKRDLRGGVVNRGSNSQVGIYPISIEYVFIGK